MLIDGSIVPAPARRPGGVFTSPWLILCVGLGIFLGLHAGTFFVMLSKTGPGDAVSGEAGILGQTARMAGALAASYLALAVAGIAIAAKTQDRILWLLPAMIWMFSPVPHLLLTGEGTVLRPLADLHTGWMWPNWVAAILDLVLVAAPGAAAVARTPPALARADRHDRFAVAMLGSLGLGVLLIRAFGDPGALNVDLVTGAPLVVLFFIGAALGVRRPWFPAVHLLCVLGLSGVSWMVASSGEPIVGVARASAPGMLALILGALGHPLGGYCRVEARRRMLALADGLADGTANGLG